MLLPSVLLLTACLGTGDDTPAGTVSAEHRSAIEAMLAPDETLKAVVYVSTGVGIGQVAGRDRTVHGVAEYLRENDIVAIGLPSTPAVAFDAGWIAATDDRLAFVVPGGGLWASPDAIAYDVPYDRVETLRWRDESSAGVSTRLYHLTYDHTNGKALDLVRRSLANDDADAFVAALGSRATEM